MKKLKLLRKKIMACGLALFMLICCSGVNANATTITTNVIETGSTYNLYVREAGSTNLLGTMKLYKGSDGVYNEFTAKKYCKSVTVYVSNKDDAYKHQTATKMYANDAVVAKKTVSNPTTIFGYCTVEY